MKLGKIALGIVSVFALSAIGGSWFTGKQVEKQYLKLVDFANQEFTALAAQGINAKLQDVTIERGIFSSKVAYRLSLSVHQENYDISGDDVLFHGPFPINRLAKFNLLPVLASVENNLSMPTVLKGVLNQDKLGQGTMNIHYSGVLDGDFTLNDLAYQDQLTWQSKPINIEYDLAPNADRFSIKLAAEQLQVFNKVQGITGKINGLSYRFKNDGTQGYPNLYLGNGELTLKDVGIENSDGNSFWLKEIKSHFSDKLNGDRADLQSQFSINQITLNQQNIGKFIADAALDVDAENMEQLLAELGKGELADHRKLELLVANLLNKAFKLQINQLALENPSHRTALNLNLNLSDFNLKNIGHMNDVLNMFTTSSFQLQIHRKDIENIVRILAQVENMSASDAEQQGKLIADELFQKAKMANIAVVDAEKISLDIAINQGKVSLNGKTLSESEMQGILLMLMLSGF